MVAEALREAVGTADTVDGPYTHAAEKQPMGLTKDDLEDMIQKFVKGSLSELTLESAGGYKMLYHIGPRPPQPNPKRPGRGGGASWEREWLDTPVKSAVFMTDNWKAVWTRHGIFGNVYTYKVPRAAIRDSGGLHRYDNAKEVIIPKDVWEKYNLQNARQGKTIDKEKATELARTPLSPDNLAYVNQVQGKPQFATFESILKLAPEKREKIIKFLTPEELGRINRELEAWLSEVDDDGYGAEKTARLKGMPGIEGVSKRLRHGSERLKIKKRIEDAKDLKKLLAMNAK